jgi:peptidoglycan/LPS O-acetylase OafA/YrhL
MRQSPTFAEHLWFPQMLRALACLAVLWVHWESFFARNEAIDIVRPLCPAPTPLPHQFYLAKILHPLQPVFSPGHCAVGLFFLISGFLIPLALRRQSRSGFLAGRLLRVFPVYWASLCLTCAARWLYGHFQGGDFSPSLGMVVSNALLVRTLFWVPTLDYVNWTLEIEILFYLIWAIVGARGGLAGKHITLLTALLLAAISVFAGRINAVRAENGLAFIEPLLGLQQLIPYVVFTLLGTCFSQLYTKDWDRRRFWTCLTLVFICWWGSLQGGGVFRPWPALRQFPVAILIFGLCYRFRDRLPTSAWLNRLAEISYPLYLLHGVIGYILLTVLYQWFPSPYWVVLLAGALILALVWIVHQFVEKPCHELARRACAALTSKVNAWQGCNAPDHSAASWQLPSCQRASCN